MMRLFKAKPQIKNSRSKNHVANNQQINNENQSQNLLEQTY